MDLSILDKKEAGKKINQEKLLEFPIRWAKNFLLQFPIRLAKNF